MRSRRDTHRLARTVQIMPLVALSLLALVWFGVPQILRARIVATELGPVSGPMLWLSEPTPETPKPAHASAYELAHQYYDGMRSLDAYRRGPSEPFQKAIGDVAGELAPRAAELLESRAPLDRSDPAFASLRHFEREWDARAWAVMLPQPPRPPLLASAITRPDLGFTEEEMRSLQATDMSDALFGSNAWPAEPGGLFLGAIGGGGGDERRVVFSGVIPRDGDLYIAFEMMPATMGDVSSVVNEGLPSWNLPGKASASVGAAGTSLGAVALSRSTNLWVFGPIELDPIPLLVPSEATAEDAEMLARSYALGMQGGTMLSGDIIELDDTLASLSGSTWAAISYLHDDYENENAGFDPETGEDLMPQPQMVLYLATWDDDPRVSPKPTGIDAIIERFRIWHATHLVTLLAVVGVAVAIGLVASPTAFVIERRNAERLRVEEERARIKRDVHDRVYNRLAAMATRLDAGIASSPQAAADDGSLVGLGDELRAASDDLREILETEQSRATFQAMKARHPDDFVVEQLSAATEAASTMHGLVSTFEGPAQASGLTPEAGWDLQCVIEEGIANAARHGHATRIDVSLSRAAGGFELRISDDGRGVSRMDLDALPMNSTGLRGMRARIERLGGVMAIEDTKDGLELIFKIPARSE